MRVGLPGFQYGMYLHIWQIIEQDLCEPIEWIPYDDWKQPNVSDLEVLEGGDVIDCLAKFTTVSDKRHQRFAFSMPIRYTAQVLI